MTIEQLRAMKPLDRHVEICRAFGWRFQINPDERQVWRYHGPVGYERFDPSTDPVADYDVLKHYRETRRGREPFCNILGGIWRDRWDKRYPDGGMCDGAFWEMYEPGDYSLAALAAETLRGEAPAVG